MRPQQITQCVGQRQAYLVAAGPQPRGHIGLPRRGEQRGQVGTVDIDPDHRRLACRESQEVPCSTVGSFQIELFLQRHAPGKERIPLEGHIPFDLCGFIRKHETGKAVHRSGPLQVGTAVAP